MMLVIGHYMIRDTIMKRFTACVLLLGVMSNALALSLRADAPARYVVKPGDTLWSISKTYLDKPWEWEELWKNNPQFSDPNQIYPGAVIEMHRTPNSTYLALANRGTRVLVPHAIKESIDHPIPPLELTAIRPFISLNQVFTEDLLPTAPYVVGTADEHLILGNGDHIYVKDLRGRPNENFAIYREDGRFYDKAHRAIIGYNAAFIANAIMVRPGNPATLVISNAHNGVRIGDRIMPMPRENNSMFFYPHKPRCPITASIVHIIDAIEEGGTHNIVVLDKGQQEGIDKGAVLSLVDEGNVVIDPVYHDRKVKMPDEVTGEVMVFRSFDHVSYALVMNSVRPAQLGDLARNPA